jgi:phage recombination protein Bet
MNELTPVTVTPEQIEVVKNTIFKGATNEELSLFLHDCQRRGVHPLDKLIHPTKRGGRYVPITSIDFLRQQADRTGCYAGYESAFSGVPATKEFACSVIVKKLVAGQVCTFTGTARWEEYYPGDGPEGGMWRKMKHNMLEKCAEALALRRAFPSLNGLYTREEMDQSTPTKEAIPLSTKLTNRIALVEESHGHSA